MIQIIAITLILGIIYVYLSESIGLLVALMIDYDRDWKDHEIISLGGGVISIWGLICLILIIVDISSKNIDNSGILMKLIGYFIIFSIISIIFKYLSKLK